MAQPGASTETPAAPESSTDPQVGTPGGPEATPAAPAPAAPDAPPAEASEFEAPFRLEDVPIEYRDHVERYINTTRPHVTRAFQSAREVEQAAQEALELADAINSPDTAFEVLRDTLDNFGIELTEDIWAEAQASQSAGAGADDSVPGLEPSTDPNVQFLVERERARMAAEAESAEQAESARLRDTVQSHLSGLAEGRGYGDGHDAVPSEISNAVAAFAAVLPYTNDGLPNTQGAQEMLEAVEARAVQDFLKRKQPDVPPEGGGPGERRADIRNTQDRLRLASDVAARAMAAHQ